LYFFSQILDHFFLQLNRSFGRQRSGEKLFNVVADFSFHLIFLPFNQVIDKFFRCFPFFFQSFISFAANVGDPVVPPPGASRLVSPVGFDTAGLLQAPERGIERRFLELISAAGPLLDCLVNLISVIVAPISLARMMVSVWPRIRSEAIDIVSLQCKVSQWRSYNITHNTSPVKVY
jgi:hypothetical protein